VLDGLHVPVVCISHQNPRSAGSFRSTDRVLLVPITGHVCKANADRVPESVRSLHGSCVLGWLGGSRGVGVTAGVLGGTEVVCSSRLSFFLSFFLTNMGLRSYLNT
jgi:hypothetical protein